VNVLTEGEPDGEYGIAAIESEEKTDQEETMLIQLAQTNPSAFEALYRRYVTRIYRYIRFRVNNDEDASDMAQQVFLKALAALPKYRLRGVALSNATSQIITD
jgi:hypothetical protein